MIIAVANTKGGTGKTTTALQLALYRQSLGHEVWLVDGDEQQSALTAVSIRSENNVKPALACSAYSDARTLKSQIETQVNKWEDIMNDDEIEIVFEVMGGIEPARTMILEALHAG